MSPLPNEDLMPQRTKHTVTKVCWHNSREQRQYQVSLPRIYVPIDRSVEKSLVNCGGVLIRRLRKCYCPSCISEYLTIDIEKA